MAAIARGYRGPRRSLSISLRIKVKTPLAPIAALSPSIVRVMLSRISCLHRRARARSSDLQQA